MSDKRIYICTGKDCRKPSKFLKAFRTALPGDYAVEEVRCQKVCKASVVGFIHEDELVWARKLRSKKDAHALLESLESDQLNKRIRVRIAKKRTGKLRH